HPRAHSGASVAALERIGEQARQGRRPDSPLASWHFLRGSACASGELPRELLAADHPAVAPEESGHFFVAVVLDVLEEQLADFLAAVRIDRPDERWHVDTRLRRPSQRGVAAPFPFPRPR